MAQNGNKSNFRWNNRQTDDPPENTAETQFIARLIGDGPGSVSADGWCWWNAKNEKTGERVRVSGHMARSVPGELLEVNGRWEQRNRKGGAAYWSFKVEKFGSALPINRGGMILWIRENFTGVGETFATALVDQLGKPSPQDAITRLDENPELFGEIKTPTGRGLSGERLATVMREWEDKRGERQLGIFFRENDISPRMIHKLYEAYGDQVLKVLEEDPYRISELRGIGFLKADEIARKLGMSMHDAKRIQAGLIYVLEQAESSGHSFLLLSELFAMSADMLFKKGKNSHLSPSEQTLCAEQAKALVGRKRVVVEREPVPEDAPEGTRGEQRVFRRRTWQLECKLAARLRWLSEQGQVHQLAPVGERPEQLTDEQWHAVEMAYTHRMSILTGLPGTGKTYTQRQIIEGVIAAKRTVLLAAPTGKAAKRMTELTGHGAMTIHRLLKWMPQEGAFLHNASNPIEADLVIVDESSMLALDLADHLFQAIGPDTHVLLVGDVNQLPPIGAGKVLDDMIESGTVPTTALTQIFRQAQSSMIIVNAHRINNKKMPYLRHDEAEQRTGRTMNKDFHWINSAEAEDIARHCVDWATVRIPNISKGKLDPMRDIMILVPMKEGPAGLKRINLMMQAKLNPKGQALGIRMLRVGDRILQTVNDYESEIMNGELAIIDSINENTSEVLLVLDDGERTASIPKANLDSFILGYAMSIHKSQGSQFKAVVLPVSYSYFNMLTRSLYYTAVTRAERLVIAIGEQRAMQAALKRQEQRNSALSERLRDAALSGSLF